MEVDEQVGMAEVVERDRAVGSGDGTALLGLEGDGFAVAGVDGQRDDVATAGRFGVQGDPRRQAWPGGGVVRSGHVSSWRGR